MMVPVLGEGPSVPVFSGEEAEGLPPTEVLRRSLGQTDPGWGLTKLPALLFSTLCAKTRRQIAEARVLL